MKKKLNLKKIFGVCLMDCAHVAGIINFFQIMENRGYNTHFLGPAVKTSRIINEIKKSDAKFIALSYRLTPEVGKKYIKNFIDQVKIEKLEDRIYLFGGLPKLCREIKKMDFFRATFEGGESIEEILSIFSGKNVQNNKRKFFPKDLISLIKFKAPYPIIRAHFGLPDIKKTIDGIGEIANAGVLDVISIAPDQAAQEWLQQPEFLESCPKGAGGVPIRKKNELNKMFEKSRTGNYPLLRIYSGTQDLIKNGKLFLDTIHNAWAAIPIFWYSKLDGRGPKSLESAIEEHLQAIKWHAEREIPVEINDPHQWGLRMAPDHLVVADAYISAYIAKQLGVKTYIEQLMFNTPVGNSFKMDLARVLAMIEIVKPLIDNSFNILKETRTGLAYLAPKSTIAKGQLCASVLIQMSVKPDILHVVSYCEGDHVAKPDEIIESATLVKRIIQDSINGLPDLTRDKEVIKRKNKLLDEAYVLLDFINKFGRSKGYNEPFLSPEYLTSIVNSGILDAPHLKGDNGAPAFIETRIIRGKCVVVDKNQDIISEKERLSQLNLDLNMKLDDIFHQNITNKISKSIRG
ncbi:MAG: methionine synthase [Promethearchaeota archaeon]